MHWNRNIQQYFHTINQPLRSLEAHFDSFNFTINYTTHSRARAYKHYTHCKHEKMHKMDRMLHINFGMSMRCVRDGEMLCGCGGKLHMPAMHS